MNYSERTFAPKPIKRYISTYSVKNINKGSISVKLSSAKTSKSQLWNSSLTTINTSSTLRDSSIDFSTFETELENDFAYLEISSILNNRSNLSSSLVFGNRDCNEDIVDLKSSNNIMRPSNPFMKNMESSKEL